MAEGTNGRSLRIGITDNFRTKTLYENYETWLRNLEPGLEVVKLSYLRDNMQEVNGLDGLVLTGGGDVHPQFYGRPEAIELVEEVNERRDEFELLLSEKALGLDLPIVAICRGMQVFNVALGGSLVLDLQSSGFDVHRGGPNGPGEHDLHVDPHAMLYFMTQNTRARVNTLHHQAVDKLGRGLKAVGFSPDGVIEAVEWVQKDGMPFFLAVQWHPERQQEEPTSRNIAALFLKGAAEFHRNKDHANEREPRT